MGKAWVPVLLAATAQALIPVAAGAQSPTTPAAQVVGAPSGDLFSLALSVDGRMLAYAAQDGATSALWLADTSGGKPRALAHTAGARFPFFSPDGRSLAFFADGKLRRMDLDSGRQSDLADAPSGRGGVWLPDGRILFAPSNVSGLSLVSAQGGAVSELTALSAGQGSHRWPVLLPDGQHVLFTVASPDEAVRGIWWTSLAGEAPRRVTGGEAAARFARGRLLKVSASGDLQAQPFDPASGRVTGAPAIIERAVATDAILQASAVAVSGDGLLALRRGAASALRQFVLLDDHGKVAKTYGGLDAASPGSPEIAPDGAAIAINRTINSDADIWLLKVKDGGLTRLTTTPSFDLQPIWTHDGKAIIYRANRHGPYDLFVKPLDGGAERTLIATPDNKAPQSLSPDGRLLLYSQQGKGANSELWQVAMDGASPPQPVVQDGADAGQGQFSPDGRQIAYNSNVGGQYQVYVRLVAGGEPTRVSPEGGGFPRWKADGSGLYFVSLDYWLWLAPRDRGGMLAPARKLYPIKLPTGRNMGFGGYHAKAQYAVDGAGHVLLPASADDPASQTTILLKERWDAPQPASRPDATTKP